MVETGAPNSSEEPAPLGYRTLFATDSAPNCSGDPILAGVNVTGPGATTGAPSIPDALIPAGFKAGETSVEPNISLDKMPDKYRGVKILARQKIPPAGVVTVA